MKYASRIELSFISSSAQISHWRRACLQFASVSSENCRFLRGFLTEHRAGIASLTVRIEWLSKIAAGRFEGKSVESFSGIWRREWDMFGSSLSLTLRAARSGPAVRLSKFDPVTAQAGCRSEHRHRRWPEGRGSGPIRINLSNQVGSSTYSRPTNTKKAPQGGYFRIWRREWDSNPRWA
jgi:hypothetical protein